MTAQTGQDPLIAEVRRLTETVEWAGRKVQYLTSLFFYGLLLPLWLGILLWVGSALLS